MSGFEGVSSCLATVRAAACSGVRAAEGAMNGFLVQYPVVGNVILPALAVVAIAATLLKVMGELVRKGHWIHRVVTPVNKVANSPWACGVIFLTHLGVIFFTPYPALGVVGLVVKGGDMLYTRLRQRATPPLPPAAEPQNPPVDLAGPPAPEEDDDLPPPLEDIPAEGGGELPARNGPSVTDDSLPPPPNDLPPLPPDLPPMAPPPLFLDLPPMAPPPLPEGNLPNPAGGGNNPPPAPESRSVAEKARFLEGAEIPLGPPPLVRKKREAPPAEGVVPSPPPQDNNPPPHSAPSAPQGPDPELFHAMSVAAAAAVAQGKGPGVS